MLKVDLGGNYAHHLLSKYLCEIVDSFLAHSLDHVDVIQGAIELHDDS